MDYIYNSIQNFLSIMYDIEYSDINEKPKFFVSTVFVMRNDLCIVIFFFSLAQTFLVIQIYSYYYLPFHENIDVKLLTNE